LVIITITSRAKRIGLEAITMAKLPITMRSERSRTSLTRSRQRSPLSQSVRKRPEWDRFDLVGDRSFSVRRRSNSVRAASNLPRKGRNFSARPAHLRANRLDLIRVCLWTIRDLERGDAS
jgi:hypothetical protein